MTKFFAVLCAAFFVLCAGLCMGLAISSFYVSFRPRPATLPSPKAKHVYDAEEWIAANPWPVRTTPEPIQAMPKIVEKFNESNETPSEFPLAIGVAPDFFYSVREQNNARNKSLDDVLRRLNDIAKSGAVATLVRDEEALTLYEAMERLKTTLRAMGVKDPCIKVQMDDQKLMDSIIKRLDAITPKKKD